MYFLKLKKSRYVPMLECQVDLWCLINLEEYFHGEMIFPFYYLSHFLLFYYYYFLRKTHEKKHTVDIL